MNPANLKRYAMRNIKLKQEKASDENFVIHRIKDLLESKGVDNETSDNYINDIFSYSGYEEYDGLTDEQILEDFYDWK
jgi:hypothetical protein